MFGNVANGLTRHDKMATGREANAIDRDNIFVELS